MAPVDSYILCTSPRSGSTLLCRLLAATGVCGAPDSHFHEPSLSAWLEEYGMAGLRPGPEREALRAVMAAAWAEGRGGTQMFGLRLQRQSAAYLFEKLALLHPDARTDRARIEAAFGRTAFVYLTRESKLDQAISYVKAQQTGLWHRAPDGREIERLSAQREPVYDAAALTRQIALFETYEREWQAWFDRERITPLRLSYEAFSTDPIAGLGQVLARLGVALELTKGIELPVARLADGTNADWAARYRAEGR